ncbi:unnamed protein product [Macrosiphum euphorbiae]|uniref:Uncharacterized protein n=1 Tax=Macrosiphum euphorbiae TaxID=13131 RepID=A0AAV0WM73_9HEMI|nr:unnamed protein product [Macrosiphum euphorbiae]
MLLAMRKPISMISARVESGGTMLKPTCAPRKVAASPSASGLSGRPRNENRVSRTPTGRRPDRCSDEHLAAFSRSPSISRLLCVKSMDTWSSSRLSAMRQRSSANANTR